MKKMSWKEAIIKVLEDSDSALHYSEIAQKVVEKGLMKKIGATPAATVNMTINQSLKTKGDTFIRSGKGEYWLKSKLEQVGEKAAESDETDNQIIKAFGMFWRRENVDWKKNLHLLGQEEGAKPIDFSEQRGVYLLHDGKDTVYVGRTQDRGMGQRLFEHTKGRLNGRWDRFSWFGICSVSDEGELEPISKDDVISRPANDWISTMEALLIDGLEPPLNRRRGDNFAREYIQMTDPKIEERTNEQVLRNAISRLKNP